ncbi:MAG: DUF1211 domain-containing protein [Bacteroidetes bacterium]|nr:DUF1211 domain-containing protein [Bacteroidota bacterium]
MINRFPNDRINNFCDAVFAIAMTLLILEIKIPAPNIVNDLGTWGALKKLTPNFAGFIVSFLVIALYWRAHLSLAQFIKVYDSKMLWLTIFLLFFIVLLPFSTAFYSTYPNYNNTFIFYCINLLFIGLFNHWMIRYLKKSRGLDEMFTQQVFSYLQIRAMSNWLVWLATIIWVFIEPLSARFLFILLFLILSIVERRYKKRVEAAAK